MAEIVESARRAVDVQWKRVNGKAVLIGAVLLVALLTR